MLCIKAARIDGLEPQNFVNSYRKAGISRQKIEQRTC